MTIWCWYITGFAFTLGAISACLRIEAPYMSYRKILKRFGLNLVCSTLWLPAWVWVIGCVLWTTYHYNGPPSTSVDAEN